MWRLIVDPIAKWATVFLTLACVTQAIAQEESDDALVARLTDRWSQQRLSMVTAEIKYRNTFRPVSVAFALKDVHALLQQAALPGNDGSIKKLVAALDPSLAKVDPPWSEIAFSFDGTNTRVDRGSQGRVRSYIRTNDHDIDVQHYNDQINIFSCRKLKIHIVSIDELCLLPPERFPTDSAVIERQPNGRVLVRDHFREYLVDEQTGFVHEYRQRMPDGSVTSEVFQFEPKQVAGNIEFPTAIFRANYRKGKLESFDLTVIDDAQLNVVVAMSTFIVPGAKGTTVVDYRNDGKVVESLERHFDDVTRRD